MPEYLAPGVFVEETSFRDKTIEGVSTSTAGFVGPTRFGPLRGEPALLTSFAEFERIYGGLEQLSFGAPTHNYVAHAVRAFFDNGGRRLHVARAFSPDSNSQNPEGHAELELPSNDLPSFNARYPGAGGNGRLTLVFRLSRNVFVKEQKVLRLARNYDVVYGRSANTTEGKLYWLKRVTDDSALGHRFELNEADPSAQPTLVSALDESADIRILTVSVIFEQSHQELAWEGLSFHAEHSRSLQRQFAPQPSANAPPIDRATELYVPLAFDPKNSTNGAALAETLVGLPAAKRRRGDQSPDPVTVRDNLTDESDDDELRTFHGTLAGGNDGKWPDADQLAGDTDATTGLKSGLAAFEDVEDISIVAVPGSTYSAGTDSPRTDAQIAAIQTALISHCERMRYRIAVMDSKNRQTLTGVRNYRSQFDSRHAALYYPWVRIVDPVTDQELDLPPCGFVAGIYARNDIERGVHKAPANEVARGAIGFEQVINQAQQEALNPEGINCFRFFEGRGFRLWGARTISSDPEWKYVNLRRYFAYVERSIDKSTQWAVFEPNREDLWGKMRRTVEDFLFNEWSSGRLMGEAPEQAYFVRCDRSTMTQNDIDNGRLVCVIGLAALRPAEFVIFRIGQWTADRSA